MGINDFSAKEVINKLEFNRVRKNFQVFWWRERSQKELQMPYY